MGHGALRRAAHRRHRAAPGQDRRDGHRRGEDARGHAAAVPERPGGAGCASRHRQQLPRPARLAVDGSPVHVARPHRGLHRRHGAVDAGAARGVSVRHHVRDEQRVRLRLPARQHGVLARAARPTDPCLRDHRRGGLDPDRRSPHPADHLGTGGQRVGRKVRAVQRPGRTARPQADRRRERPHRPGGALDRQRQDGVRGRDAPVPGAARDAEEQETVEAAARARREVAGAARGARVLADRKQPARDQKLRHIEDELYFVLDERGHSVHLTEQGVETMSPQDPNLFVVPDISHAVHEIDHDEHLSPKEKIERRRQVEGEYALKSETLHIIHKLLQAHALYEREVDYVVQEGKVLIVDEFTGRLMHGRRWSEGLHQAVEAKEGVAVQEESQTLATITIQNYFRMYDKLAGMTGTAETEETEFFQIYGLEVVVIPTNRPVRRVDKHDLIYKTRSEKYKAILDEVERQHERGLPILVGTVNVDVSETLSRMLKRRGFRHEVLNAKYHQREAEIVAQAGQPASITIATNMAGRGTDIKLGPGVKKCQVCGITAHEAPFGQQIERPDLSAEEIKRLGCNDDPPCGLVIVGTERHEARRIDRQLRGRAGRQGDPGQSVFFLSLEDDLMRLFGSDRIARIMDRTGSEENEVITHPWVTAAIGQAQKRVELQNFQSRKKLLEYDDVMNQQREVIYALRLFALEGGEELKAEALRMVEQAVAELVDELIGDTKNAYQWDRALMETEFLLKFLVSVPGVTDPARIRSRDELVRTAQQAAREAFQAKLDHFKEIEAKVGAVNIGAQALSHVMLTVIDEKWKDHLYDLDQLKAAIHYRQWGQKDPLIEYKREGYEMFVGLMRDVHATFAERWLKLQIEIGPPPPRAGSLSPGSGPGGGLVKGPSPRRPAPMVASKPAVDGLVSGEPAVASQPSPVGAGVAPNPYAGI